MTGEDLELAWSAFEDALTRNAKLPLEERGRAALRAAFSAVIPDEIAEQRARKIIAEVALKHDTTSVDIRRDCRTVNVVAAREEAAFELARAGFGHRAIARLLGRSAQSQVRIWLDNHEARMPASETGRKESVG